MTAHGRKYRDPSLPEVLNAEEFDGGWNRGEAGNMGHWIVEYDTSSFAGHFPFDFSLT